MLTIIDLLRKKLVNSWGKTVSRQKTEVAPGSFILLSPRKPTNSPVTASVSVAQPWF